MAAAVGSNNIYPPVVTPFAPNFIIGKEKGCRVYFSISAYNSISDYHDIHITVTQQSNNTTALSKKNYPSKIKIAPISTIMTDTERTSSDRYYITIDNDDIEGGFQTGIVYKVQMRFSSSMSNRYDKPQKVDDYLSANLAAFSEWSQVCLVQGIHQPELQIKNGKGGTLVPQGEGNDNNTLNHDTLEIVGTLITDDTDPLRQYTLNLYNDKEELVETSGVLFPAYQSSKDQLNYVFKKSLQDGESYILEVKYMTYGLFEDAIRYPLFLLSSSIEQLNAYIIPIEDEENGRIGIHITTDAVSAFAGIITIRRTSSKTDFQLWEDVHTIELRDEKLDYTWYDYTVESGVWYKYCAQKRDGAGNRGVVTMLDTPLMIVFDSLFLSADGQQIKIKYNPQISSFQTTVSDTKIDTIGAKYPYIKRNGATAYRQFPISGLITIMMDEDKIFADRDDFYNKETLSLFDEYNEKNRIDKYNDITYERDFREKVMAFLYKHNVKLYRSATEGNILVKLMNITFQPNQTLGRRIYSFQCTAYEVADCTIENIDYYGIQEVQNGIINGDVISITSTALGQWDSTIPANQEFVHAAPAAGQYSILESYYNKLQKQNYILSVSHLNYLRLEIYDEPYAILDTGVGSPQPYNDITMTLLADDMPGSIYMGYIAYINGKTIVIPEDGHYELKGEGLEIQSLSFAKDTNLEVRYNVVINQIEDVSKILSVTNFMTKIGQEQKGFTPMASFYNDLYKKYYTDHPGNYAQSIASLNGIRVNANPGTIVYVKEDGEMYAQRHIIGQTESLDFYSDDVVISDVYFSGMHFEQATDYELMRDTLPEGKCHITEIVVDNLDKIENPQERHVYYLQSSNHVDTPVVVQQVIEGLDSPYLATIITAKGLPIYHVETDNMKIAIIESRDFNELAIYLTNLGYEIYFTDSLFFEGDNQIKVATDIDTDNAIEFVMDSEENRIKMAAFKVILDQYGDKQITASLKRQIWKDVSYSVSDYYIYYNGHWFVFDIDNQDAVCPVPASIDYVCEVVKQFYRTSGIR